MEQENTGAPDSSALAGPVGDAAGPPMLSPEERRYYSERLLSLVDEMERIYHRRVSQLEERDTEVTALSGHNDELSGLLDRLVALIERSLKSDGWEAAQRAIETLASLLGDAAPAGSAPAAPAPSPQTAPASRGPAPPAENAEGALGRSGDRPFRDVDASVLEGEFSDEDDDAKSEWPDAVRDAAALFFRTILEDEDDQPLALEDALPMVPQFAAGINQRLTIALDPDSAQRSPEAAIGEESDVFELQDPGQPKPPPPPTAEAGDADDPFVHFPSGSDEDGTQSAAETAAPGDGAEPGAADATAKSPVLEFQDDPKAPPVLEFEEVVSHGATDPDAEAEEDAHLFDKFPDAPDAPGVGPQPDADRGEFAPDPPAPDIRQLLDRLHKAAERARSRWEKPAAKPRPKAGEAA